MTCSTVVLQLDAPLFLVECPVVPWDVLQGGITRQGMQAVLTENQLSAVLHHTSTLCLQTAGVLSKCLWMLFSKVRSVCLLRPLPSSVCLGCCCCCCRLFMSASTTLEDEYKQVLDDLRVMRMEVLTHGNGGINIPVNLRRLIWNAQVGVASQLVADSFA